MCIIAFQYKTHPQYDLIVAANRDEFYERPAKPVYEWTHTTPRIIAGQDELEKGTWLGINEHGRFAALTNYRDPSLQEKRDISRGHIVTHFLTSEHVSAEQFSYHLQQNKERYGPFNAIMYDGEKLFHYNNVTNIAQEVAPGIHTLSNATLNTPWPKTKKLHNDFSNVLRHPNIEPSHLWPILQQDEQAPDEQLPSTGVPLHWERGLSSIFIKLGHYGTRASTALFLNKQQAHLEEITYEQGDFKSHIVQTITF